MSEVYPRPLTAVDILIKCFVSGASLNGSAGRWRVCLNGLQHKISLFMEQTQKQQIETWPLITTQEGLPGVFARRRPKLLSNVRKSECCCPKDDGGWFSFARTTGGKRGSRIKKGWRQISEGMSSITKPYKNEVGLHRTARTKTCRRWGIDIAFNAPI